MVMDGPLWRRTTRRRHARAVIRSCASGGARVDGRRSNARAGPRRAKFGWFDARRRRTTRGGRAMARDQAWTSDILVAIRDARRRECPSPACAGSAAAVSARNRGVRSGGVDGDRRDRAAAARRSPHARRQACRSFGARGARCGDRRAHDRRAGVDATQTSRPQSAATISWERDDLLQTADIYRRSADKSITRDKLLQPAAARSVVAHDPGGHRPRLFHRPLLQPGRERSAASRPRSAARRWSPARTSRG